MNTRAAVLIMGLLCLTTLIAPAQNYGVRIAFIGNSITYGAGVPNPATQSYPAQLGDLLEETFGDTCVVGNFGVSARTMLKNGDFPIWDETAFDQALAFKPNIVVIALGTNDSKPQNWDVYGSEFYDDYTSMVDTFKHINPYMEFYVCYPSPAFEIVWDIRDSVIVNGVIPVVDQIMAEAGAELIDFYTPLTDSVHLFPDYIHPNIEGAAAMAQIVYDRFTETDVIREAGKGVAFITHVESDRQYITSRDSVGTLSWNTINADAVYLDGSEVDFNGSQEVNHHQGTTHTLIAEGEKYSDTVVYEFISYAPEVDKITLSASEVSIFTEDTITVTASYEDQNGYPLNDTVIDLQWSVTNGEGTLFGPMNNSVFFTSTVSGSSRISGSYMGISRGIWVHVRAKDPTYNDKIAALPEIEVFPNPFDDCLVFMFNLTETGSGTLKIIDLQGKTCIHRKIGQDETGQYSLDTHQLPEGIYLYEMQTGKRLLTGKLVKSHGSSPNQ